MKPEDIKQGETYVNDWDSERTVVEIRPGIPKNKQHIIYVRYFQPQYPESIQQVRLTDFAKWAQSVKFHMPFHSCEAKKEQENVRNSIRYNPLEKRWFIRVSYEKMYISFCPFCGEELKTRNSRTSN